MNRSDVRAEALFLSSLQRSDEPTDAAIRAAVIATLELFGERRCAEAVAQQYGEHEELSAARMRWAIHAVAEAFSPAAMLS